MIANRFRAVIFFSKGGENRASLLTASTLKQIKDLIELRRSKLEDQGWEIDLVEIWDRTESLEDD